MTATMNAPATTAPTTVNKAAPKRIRRAQGEKQTRKEVRLAIVGSRLLRPLHTYLASKIRELGLDPQDKNLVILTTGSAGVGQAAASFAEANKLKHQSYALTDADWKANPNAGYDASERMAKQADHLLALSRGDNSEGEVRRVVDAMNKAKKPVLLKTLS